MFVCGSAMVLFTCHELKSKVTALIAQSVIEPSPSPIFFSFAPINHIYSKNVSMSLLIVICFAHLGWICHKQSCLHPRHHLGVLKKIHRNAFKC